MEERDLERIFREVYRSLCIAPAADQTIRGIAGVRLLMINLLGEDRQRDLISRWNEEPPAVVPAAETAPPWLQGLATLGLQSLWVQAGLPQDIAGSMSHLFHRMTKMMFRDTEPASQLWDKVDERLANQPPDYSHARIIGYDILALQLMRADSEQASATARRILAILAEWRTREPELGFEYEDRLLEWILERAHACHRWAESARRGLLPYLR